MGEQEHGDDVGSVADEAAKLLGALRGWAADHDHLATDSEACRFCPLCQLIAAVRGTSPEVREHLGAAASSLVKAAASALATHVPDHEEEGRRSADVERIDLDDDEGEPWD